MSRDTYVGRILVTGTLGVAALGLAACGVTNAIGGAAQSVQDKATTVQVCISAAQDVQQVAGVAAQLATAAISPAEAANKLQTAEKNISALGQSNASTAIGKSLTKLAGDLGALQKVSATDVNAAQSAAGSLAADAKAILADCAAVGQ